MKYAIVHLSDPTDAEDAVQNTYVDFYRRIERYGHLDILSPEAFLKQMLKREIIQNYKEREQMPRADINDITPFPNTLKYNYGDSIVELYTPPIGDQGSQGSCMGWAFGYGCVSIQAYNAYQDWNWARRSPAFF